MIFIIVLILSSLTVVFLVSSFLWKRRRISIFFKTLQINENYFINAVAKFDKISNKNFYICDSEFQEWRNEFNFLIKDLPPWLNDYATDDQFRLTIKKFYRCCCNGRTYFIDPHNEKFIQTERPIIENILKASKLKGNNDQVGAIASDEDNTLLVAGAGTGKTTTILGKLAYLTKHLGVNANDILLLSFTGRAVGELSERIAKKFPDSGLKVRTFHSFGLSVIGEARGVKPSMAFVNEADRKRFLSEQFDECLKHEDYRRLAVEYFAYYFHPITAEPEFENLDEYYKSKKLPKRITLKSEVVKSRQEAMIANFLFLNGVNYIYEAPYKFATADKIFRQYCPDFYLPDYDIYLEHFGIDKNGLTHFTRNEEQNRRKSAEYQAGIKWKRDMHKMHQTKLIETYSYEFDSSNNWQEQLSAKLKAYGVAFSNCDSDKILLELRRSGEIKQIAELFATFLDLCKSNCYSVGDVQNIIASRGNPRESAFFKIFSSLYLYYSEHLKQTGMIDFHDMLLEAAEHIAGGRYSSKYKYIIIDEFQDFSASKAKLIKALCDQNPKTKLFCVGDDWQSIFRFAGSDVSLMTNFEVLYGFTRKNQLVVTNRFNDRLAVISNRFILKNPSQIHKEVRSNLKVDFEPLEIIHEKAARETDYFLSEILDDLNQTAINAGPASVFLLGRYKHNLPVNLSQYQKYYRNLSVEFLTIHASKGSEADYVVILDVCSGKYGFPSEISDDPILEIVLNKRELYPNAEERRLMYVAMTRARKKVFIITRDGAESTFVLELERSKVSNGKKIICQDCGGEMVKRESRYGEFYGCSNYPKCEFKINLKRWRY